MTRVKSKCNDCEKSVVNRGLRKLGNGSYCYSCWRRRKKEIIIRGTGKVITKGQAINNIYNVKMQYAKYPTGIIHVPRSLIGLKVKLVEVKDKSKENKNDDTKNL